MTGGGPGLALVGVVAWVAVLATTGARRSVYRTFVEALGAQAVVATLVSVALVSGGSFRVTSAQALAAVIPLLLFGQLLEVFRVRARGVAVLALVGLAFNLYFAVALYRNPTYTDEMRFVEDVAARVGGNRVLFARNLWRQHRMVRRLLAFPLAHVHGIAQISVLDREGSPADEAIARYAQQLRLRDAAVLALEPPSDGRAFATVELTQRMLAKARFYPHASVERVRRFYLYNVAF